MPRTRKSSAMSKMSMLTALLLGAKIPANPAPVNDFQEDSSSRLPMKDDAAINAEYLSAVGRENEEIRRRHDSIIRKAGLLSTLEDDLSEVFGHTSQILDDLERTKSELAKREAIGKFEREANEAALQRIKELGDAHERARSELDLLHPEMQRLSALSSEAEIKIAHHESESAMLRDQLAGANRELTKQSELARYSAQELEASRTELKMADLVIAQRNTDVAESAQRLEIAEKSISTFNVALAESQNALARGMTDLEDARVGLDASRNRIANLESELHDFQQEHTRMRGLWQREADQHRADVAELQSQLDQANGVSGVHERLLAEARIELQTKNDEIKRAERRAQEAELAANHGEHKFKAAEASRDAALLDHASAKAQQKTMLRRVKPLIASLREKHNETSQMALRIQDLDTRLEARASELATAAASSEARVRALIEELEAERSRRMLAEGALSTDRDARAAEDASSADAGDQRFGDGEMARPTGPRLLLGRSRVASDTTKLKRGRRPFEAA